VVEIAEDQVTSFQGSLSYKEDIVENKDRKGGFGDIERAIGVGISIYYM
jgi:hypothetical protein